MTSQEEVRAALTGAGRTLTTVEVAALVRPNVSVWDRRRVIQSVYLTLRKMETAGYVERSLCGRAAAWTVTGKTSSQTLSGKAKH